MPQRRACGPLWGCPTTQAGRRSGWRGGGTRTRPLRDKLQDSCLSWLWNILKILQTVEHKIRKQENNTKRLGSARSLNEVEYANCLQHFWVWHALRLTGKKDGNDTLGRAGQQEDNHKLLLPDFIVIIVYCAPAVSV